MVKNYSRNVFLKKIGNIFLEKAIPNKNITEQCLDLNKF